MHELYPHLFEPITVRGLKFKNRIISAPNGSWLMTPRNYGYDYAIDYLEEKAKGGCAEVIIGDTEVNADLPEQDSVGVYYNLRGKDGTFYLNQIANSVQQHGAHLCLQLNHAGEYFGPSVNSNRHRTAREMTEREIWEVIEQFATCAGRLRETGFHMVMIHGAHGKMLDQFTNAAVNHRTDRWGGSLENRIRFPLEVAKAVREAIGDKMLIEYRISGADPETDPERFQELVFFTQELEKYIDMLHVSAGGMEGKTALGQKGGATTYPTYLSPLAPHTYLAGALKKHLSIPVVAVGGITTPALAESILAKGEADFIALCRPIIADPQWARKARECRAEDIRPCIGCHKCLEVFHHTHIHYCSVNPTMGAEHRLPAQLTKSEEPRDVAVIGGGPVGMEAAIRACDKGHRVTLIEKGPALGGLLRHTDDDPIKYRLKDYKDYMVRQVEKRDIKVLLNTTATPELVASLKPYAIISAVGSVPLVPPIPGADGQYVLNALNLFSDGKNYAGKRVCVVGGNLVGCELAVALNEQGAKVTLVEMADKIHAQANDKIAVGLDARIAGTEILTGARCTAITADSVTVDIGGESRVIPTDHVVMAVGMRSLKSESEQFRYLAPEFYDAGDCLQPRTLFEVVREGFWAAMDI